MHWVVLVIVFAGAGYGFVVILNEGRTDPGKLSELQAARSGVNDRKEMDAERKHLETLLKDRLNFYLVFASLFVLGLYRGPVSSPAVEVLLTAGTMVSLLLFLAVLRTYLLVSAALRELRSYTMHPSTPQEAG